jgi:8-oxo-dGTP diphosphatase
MFDVATQRVLLIRKRRPAWQAGKLNGVGGKIEAAESPIQALVREVREEAALDTVPEQWRYFGVMDGPEFLVHCFELRDDGITGFRSLTDETLELVAVDLELIRREGQRGLAALVAHALNGEEPFMRLSYGPQAESEKQQYPAFE